MIASVPSTGYRVTSMNQDNQKTANESQGLEWYEVFRIEIAREELERRFGQGQSQKKRDTDVDASIEPRELPYNESKWADSNERRGVEFQWNFADAEWLPSSFTPPKLTSVIASDGAEYNFEYQGKQVRYIKRDNTPSIELELTYSAARLNATRQQADANNVVRHLFAYQGEGYVTSESWSDAGSNVTRMKTFTYATGSLSNPLLKTVELGQGASKITYTVTSSMEHIDKLIVAGEGDLLAWVELNGSDVKAFSFGGVAASVLHREVYFFDTAGRLTQRESKKNGTVFSREQWTYNVLDGVRSMTDNLGRKTYWVYDYQAKRDYASKEDDLPTANDLLPKYDPSDNRGNVLVSMAVSGFTHSIYETDNEKPYVGFITEQFFAGTPELRKPFNKIFGSDRMTYFVYHEGSGLLKRTETVRGIRGSYSTLFGRNEDDAMERWEYGSDLRLSEYKNTAGLSTKYVYANRKLAKETTIDSSAGGITTDKVMARDSLGFLDKVTSWQGTTQISTLDVDYDFLGRLVSSTTTGQSSQDMLAKESLEYFPDGSVKKSISGKPSSTHLVTTFQYNTSGQLIVLTKGKDQSYHNEAKGHSLLVEQNFTYTYYADGTLKEEKQDNQHGDSKEYYYQYATVGTLGLVNRTWIATKNVAGTTEDVLPVFDRTDVVMSAVDRGGRLIEEDNLLRGGKTTYWYGDPRVDQATRVEVRQLSQDASLIVDSQFNAFGKKVLEKRGSLSPTATAYDELGFVVKTQSLATKGGIQTYNINSSGQVLATTETRRNTAGEDSQIKTSWTYNERGEVRSQTGPYDGSTLIVPVQEFVYSYDSGGLYETKMTDLYKDFQTTTKQNAIGSVVFQRNPLGGTVETKYDERGQVVKTTTQTDVGKPDQVEMFEYDPHGRMRKRTFETRQTYFDYFDRPLQTAYGWDLITTHVVNDIRNAGIGPFQTLRLESGTRLDSLGNLALVVDPHGTGQYKEGANFNPLAPEWVLETDLPAQVTGYSYLWGLDSVTIESKVTSGLATSVSAMPTGLSTGPYVQKTRNTVTTSGASLKTEMGGNPNTELGYDGSFRILSSAQLDGLGRPVTQTVAGIATTYLYDDTDSGTGLVKTSTTPDTEVPTYFYDSAGNVTKTIINGESDKQVNKFDAQSRTISIATSTRSGKNVNLDNTNTYQGKTTKFETGRSIGNSVVTTEDFANRTVTEVGKYGITPYTNLSKLDYLGRVVETKQNGIVASKTEYNVTGTTKSIEDGEGLKTTWVYDDFDRPIVETDPNGNSNTKRYNAAGQLDQVLDANLNATYYGYDPLGRMTTSIDAKGKITRYGYDIFGNRVSLTDPNGNKTSWKYDTNNRLGQTKGFAYDPAGRVGLLSKVDGTAISYDYDPGTHTQTETWLATPQATTPVRSLTFQFDVDGKLIEAIDGNNRVSREYNGGLLEKETIQLKQGLLASSHYEFRDGEIFSTRTYVGSTLDSTVNYRWNSAGQIESIEQKGSTSTTKRVEYEYDKAGKRTSLKRFQGANASVEFLKTTYVYATSNNHMTDRLMSMVHQSGGNALASYANTWDAGGRLRNVDSLVDGVVDYTYDTVNQLVTANYAQPQLPDVSLGYDSNGNRNTNGNVPGPDNRQQSDSTWNFVYDANGNLASRANKTTNAVIEYTYDHRNRLTEVRYKTSATGSLTKQVKYEYDALDRRTSRSLDVDGNGTIDNVVYWVNQGLRSENGNAGDSVALQLNSSGAVTHRMFRGTLVDEVLAEEQVNSANLLWSLPDHLGSVRDIARLNSQGTVEIANHIVYDPFGSTVSETDTALGELYGYTGREQDSATGLQYNRARYYDPSLGRFLSQDPISFAGGDANLYRYVGNGPTNASDPSGLFPVGDENEQQTPEPVWDANGKKILYDFSATRRGGFIEGVYYVDRFGSGVLSQPCVICHGRDVDGPLPGLSPTDSFVGGNWYHSGSPGNIVGNHLSGVASGIYSGPASMVNLGGNVIQDLTFQDREDLMEIVNRSERIRDYVYPNRDRGSLITTAGEISGSLIGGELVGPAAYLAKGGSGKIINFVGRLELNPVVQVYSGFPINMLRLRKSSSVGTVASDVAPEMKILSDWLKSNDKVTSKASVGSSYNADNFIDVLSEWSRANGHANKRFWGHSLSITRSSQERLLIQLH
jgi:RHS repeat-associated protein